jgi:thiazole synthase ThiGH ThiG subunit
LNKPLQISELLSMAKGSDRAEKLSRNWGLVEVRDAGLRVQRDQNVIIGTHNICNYIGLKSQEALRTWVDKYAFPAVMRPDGLWMTTMTAVDEWIFLCLLGDKAIAQRSQHSPNAQAMKVGVHTGRIAPQTQSQRTNEYKRAWEQRTGKTPRYYENGGET